MMRHGDLAPHELAAFVDGALPPSRARDVKRHADLCVSCRQQIDDLEGIIRALQRDEPDLRQIELTSPHAAASLTAPPRRSRIPAWVGVAAAVAASVAVALLVQPRGRVDYRSRASAVAEPERWTGVHVFRSTGGLAPTPVGKAIGRDDALVFSYLNASAAPFAYLMILGVDAAGAVHWYYPAYLDSHEDPASIPTEPAQHAIVLPERIRHRLAPGPLTLRAIFSRQPLRVKDIEATFTAASLRGPAPLAIPVDTVQQTLEIDAE